ncbi:MAG TPA: ABC transporter permease [candidate division Zixibacteria bacterium]|nr:ABC transporter permease [candidate division Zixibacteria bacterium]
MNKMVFANLFHRPLRSLISVVAIAVEVTLILLVVGLCMGFIDDSAQRQKGIGFDVMVSPPGSSFLTGITGAPVSMKVADKLRELPHVAAVTPIVMHMVTSGRLEVIDGIDLNPSSPNDFDRIGRPFQYLAGGPFNGPDDMIIDDIMAKQSHIKVGDTMELLSTKFRVCGIVEHGKGARRYVPIATLQNLIGSEGKASMFYVQADNSANADLITSEIKQVPGMEQYVVRSIAEYSTLMTPANMPGLNIFFNVVIGVSVVIGFLVIFQSMYTAVMERTREIGILKSLGANKFYIINVVLRESFVLAVGGIVAGIGISALSRFAILNSFPVLHIVWSNGWILRTAVLAVFGALLGALYPAFKAAQKDPIDALAYE